MTRVVIRGGQVFDSIGGTASIADIVMEGGRIVDVGTALDGDDAIDATGHAVYPGFIDSHVHFMVDGDLDPMSSVHTPFSMNFYLAAERMARTLAAGVTTVREAGGSDLGVKTAQQRGLHPWPRHADLDHHPQPDRRARRLVAAVWRAHAKHHRRPPSRASRTTSSMGPRRCARRSVN